MVEAFRQLDPDVVEALRQEDSGWQARINKILLTEHAPTSEMNNRHQAAGRL